MWIQKKNLGGGGEVRRLFEFGGEGGVPSHIFVISNVI